MNKPICSAWLRPNFVEKNSSTTVSSTCSAVAKYLHIWINEMITCLPKKFNYFGIVLVLPLFRIMPVTGHWNWWLDPNINGDHVCKSSCCAWSIYLCRLCILSKYIYIYHFIYVSVCVSIIHPSNLVYSIPTFSNLSMYDYNLEAQSINHQHPHFTPFKWHQHLQQQLKQTHVIAKKRVVSISKYIYISN